MTEQPFIVGLAQLRQLPVNREQNRVVFNEQKRIFDALFEVEKRFCDSIFDQENVSDYGFFYSFYLDQFSNNVEYIKQTVKPRWWIVNEHYFSENFKPLLK